PLATVSTLFPYTSLFRSFGRGLTSRVAAGGQAAYYDFDRLGSTVGISGATGAYQNIYRYLPFGALLTSSGTVPNPFQFVGQFGVDRKSTRLNSSHQLSSY